MEPNPQVDFIFKLCADLDPRARLGVAVSVIATEAMRISQSNADLKAYMDHECGPGWDVRHNGGLIASMAFIRYIHEDRFNKPRPLPPATIEA